ncbi:uncharacterized protein ACA1_275570 [Acanthamoeba castellanii str. Neff]|uniref:THH1/TOM1/TOM3 domain-containing protein n=1 Tax=Acanthamoeba castellanii (strain ATCC 30010 / Neff) TaxID=1257118 RepID=L8GRX9_ACACF|nr:uncharacterized protein ACA1_275570 [Acanthamoeba castellanii str. Neff]ELR15383.1 hypothetical protein ACA1_275570 [Acanthamoeba castellanii str. Neff]
MATTDLIDGVVGLSMYSTLLVITIAAYVWTGFRTVRWVWLALRTFYQTDDESPVTFILNRIAFCLYFTSFLLVLFYWMETYHRNYIDVDGVGAFLPRLRWVFVVTVVAIYIFQMAILILFLASGEERDGDPVRVSLDQGFSHLRRQHHRRRLSLFDLRRALPRLRPPHSGRASSPGHSALGRHEGGVEDARDDHDLHRLLLLSSRHVPLPAGDWQLLAPHFIYFYGLLRARAGAVGVTSVHSDNKQGEGRARQPVHRGPLRQQRRGAGRRHGFHQRPAGRGQQPRLPARGPDRGGLLREHGPPPVHTNAHVGLLVPFPRDKQRRATFLHCNHTCRCVQEIRKKYFSSKEKNGV